MWLGTYIKGEGGEEQLSPMAKRFPHELLEDV